MSDAPLVETNKGPAQLTFTLARQALLSLSETTPDNHLHYLSIMPVIKVLSFCYQIDWKPSKKPLFPGFFRYCLSFTHVAFHQNG